MHKAHAIVETEKASRYMKALCNHFDRKVTATYDDDQGTVQFGFGDCQMQASSDSLVIDIQADGDENFNRIKHVIGDHLIRFSGEDITAIEWVDES
ncbi:MAG: DUF2218 domain-containing protein [Anaerolineae bacterium]|nr:DUF2218 domain-containing protein [Anaerolineae bacterium]MCA9893871.1 DUF2218 domain-containing protein [Anaerolineae bacterium]MCB9462043.1 DUF2218 domain-containing protein [Anaerolineaceae bacterium]